MATGETRRIRCTANVTSKQNQMPGIEKGNQMLKLHTCFEQALAIFSLKGACLDHVSRPTHGNVNNLNRAEPLSAISLSRKKVRGAANTQG